MPKGKPHPKNALTAATVRTLQKPGRHADGNGLYLVVEKSGAKRWELRTVVMGRRCDIGLGGLRLVSLAAARRKAVELRMIARAGGDPLKEKRGRMAVIPTFSEAASEVHQARRAGWKNPKHADQWINTIRRYANPVIGETHIDQVTTPDILRILSPIWLTKPETARRVKQRLAAVFDWAKAAGHVEGENPVFAVAKGLPKQPDASNHHQAVPAAETPDLIRKLRECEEERATALALEFLILTATRSAETRLARLEEFDLDNKFWTIPAARMKGGREHRVPLSARCIEIIKTARRLYSDSLYLFPGRKHNAPLSDMALLARMRRTGRTETVHGFRSTFRDWAAEATNFPNEVCEMALAHTIRNKTEAAYRRGDLFEKRRKLMLAWSQHLESPRGDVIRLRTA